MPEYTSNLPDNCRTAQGWKLWASESLSVSGARLALIKQVHIFIYNSLQ